MTLQQIQSIADPFRIPGALIRFHPFGDGHINATYVAYFQQEDGSTVRYIIQEINTVAFKNPVEVAENIQAVTSYLKEKIVAEGGDPNRETLTFLQNEDGTYYRWDDEKRFYRISLFLEGTTAHQTVTPHLFYQSAKAFGRFAKRLDGFDASGIFDTIPCFHNTEHRFQNLLQQVERDPLGRLSGCQEEVEFARQREQFCSVILNEIRSGAIPLRVCHNDTKLNNVLFDNESQQALCVIDLDTVMQGSLLYDFGDAIRFGASSAPEDEENLNLVFCDLEKYSCFVRGYLEEAGEILSPTEFELLAHSAMLMTFECGMRFLTDHLEGDVYFRIHRENHNLIRARNQFKLVADMEQKLAQMVAINHSHS